MAGYRACWLAVTAVVVAIGSVLAVGGLALAAPGASLVLLGLAVPALWYVRRPGSRLRPDLRAWAGEDQVPADVRAAVATPVVVVLCLAYNLVLGTAGTVLVLLDVAAGLPLLWPRPDALTLDDLLEAGAPEAAAQDDVPPGVAAADLTTADTTAADPGPAPNIPSTMPPTVPPTVPRQPAELSPAELCHAWLASSGALQRCTSPGAQARVVAARRRYLDAIAAWDPEGFARWTASEDPADSDPSPYIRLATSREHGPG